MSERVTARGGPGRAGWAVLVGLLALGALPSVVPSTAAAPPAGKDGPKGSLAPLPAPRLPGLFGDLDPDEVEEMQAELERLQQEMLRALLRGMRPGGRPLPGDVFNPFAPGRMTRPPEPRLGVRVAPPTATLADQLDLPRDRGLVLEEVRPDSPAARAGLKAHDVLLELDGKPVPSRVEEFVRQLARVGADKPVEAVVLRKGRKETIKGLSLPRPRRQNDSRPGDFGFPLFP